ncbi:muscarinic acetylcholine receptor M5-like, partial [Convolutriloba macropyga]|uniref:muscarinic acetylcholine receptor M5-like n=1 Tax=Convolutriloba macropyga TaxID=536237 RepID=UPI003F520A04
LVSLLTISGNVLVIVAFFRNPRLKTTANMYIVSLSVADMLVGCVSIPFYSFYYVTGEWILGQFVCNCWLMLDYSLCYASMLAIFVICIDRFWSVSKPAHYMQKATFKVALWFLGPVWIYPLTLFLFMVWLWPIVL